MHIPSVPDDAPQGSISLAGIEFSWIGAGRVSHEPLLRGHWSKEMPGGTSHCRIFPPMSGDRMYIVCDTAREEVFRVLKVERVAEKVEMIYHFYYEKWEKGQAQTARERAAKTSR